MDMDIVSYEDYARQVVKLQEQRDALLAICQEIADNQIDLKDSERRIRLYAAITKAGGTL
jgi:hypothetical protein